MGDASDWGYLRRDHFYAAHNPLPRDPAGIMVMVSFRATPDGRSAAYSWHRALSNLYVADGLG